MTARRALRALGILVGLVVAATLVAGAAVAVLAVRVQGSSMSPTLTDGQRILVAPGSGGRAARFDVVVLKEPGTDTAIVKRIVAVAGDGVAIHNGVLEVRPGNTGPWRQLVSKAVFATPCCDGNGREDPAGGAVVVPAGAVFVLGDNPDASEDSRDFGWARLADVRGRVVWSAWPPGRLAESPVLESRGQ